MIKRSGKVYAPISLPMFFVGVIVVLFGMIAVMNTSSKSWFEIFRPKLEVSSLFPLPTPGPFFTPTPGGNYNARVREAARKMSTGDRFAEYAYRLLKTESRDSGVAPQVGSTGFGLVTSPRIRVEDANRFFTYDHSSRRLVVFNDYAEEAWTGIHVLSMTFAYASLKANSAPLTTAADDPKMATAIVDALNLGLSLATRLNPKLEQSIYAAVEKETASEGATIVRGAPLLVEIDPNVAGVPGSKDYLTKASIYEYGVYKQRLIKRLYEGNQLNEELVKKYQTLNITNR